MDIAWTLKPGLAVGLVIKHFINTVLNSVIVDSLFFVKILSQGLFAQLEEFRALGRCSRCIQEGHPPETINNLQQVLIFLAQCIPHTQRSIADQSNDM